MNVKHNPLFLDQYHTPTIASPPTVDHTDPKPLDYVHVTPPHTLDDNNEYNVNI